MVCEVFSQDIVTNHNDITWNSVENGVTYQRNEKLNLFLFNSNKVI
jgi:hypothetical protein